VFSVLTKYGQTISVIFREFGAGYLVFYV
jgi:hypothetical protein